LVTKSFHKKKGSKEPDEKTGFDGGGGGRGGGDSVLKNAKKGKRPQLTQLLETNSKIKDTGVPTWRGGEVKEKSHGQNGGSTERAWRRGTTKDFPTLQNAGETDKKKKQKPLKRPCP